VTESDVAPLLNELKQIRDEQIKHATMLAQHMQTSNTNSELLRSEITDITTILNKAVADTHNLYSAMPEDEHGRPSLFQHKSDHSGNFKKKRKDDSIDTFWGDIFKDAVKYLVIGALGIFIVVVGLGAKDLLSYYFKPQPASVQEQAPTFGKINK
jgi:hypothetical protein